MICLFECFSHFRIGKFGGKVPEAGELGHAWRLPGSHNFQNASSPDLVRPVKDQRQNFAEQCSIGEPCQRRDGSFLVTRCLSWGLPENEDGFISLRGPSGPKAKNDSRKSSQELSAVILQLLPTLGGPSPYCQGGSVGVQSWQLWAKISTEIGEDHWQKKSALERLVSEGDQPKTNQLASRNFGISNRGTHEPISEEPYQGLKSDLTSSSTLLVLNPSIRTRI